MTIIHICLNPDDSGGSLLTGMLNVLLSPRISAEKKILTLNSKYQDVIAEELEEEPAALSVYYNAVTENPHASADEIWENLQKK